MSGCSSELDCCWMNVAVGIFGLNLTKGLKSSRKNLANKEPWFVDNVTKSAGVRLLAGYWFGVELDQPTGKHDGSVFGVRYFSCLPKYGVFAPPSRVQRYEGTDLCCLLVLVWFSFIMSSM